MSRSARLHRQAHAILDEGCEIPDGMTIGADRASMPPAFHVTENGVVLVTPDMLAKLALSNA